MKKGIVVLTSCIFLFAAVSLFANGKLMTAHKNYKGFKVIAKCTDCHNTTTKLEKKKGQDFKALLKTANCAGAGCHK
ncbi:MAG: hypothetical protein CVV44_21675 [Spirochaetae bacterium HGW-Spirochaetae-1]|jgi:cytochrome c2|nr:MAG: hypothetical protein CVV44_21675 [Spirochaetae bacterium HGW-Spirochaetae-1]